MAMMTGAFEQLATGGDLGGELYSISSSELGDLSLEDRNSGLVDRSGEAEGIRSFRPLVVLLGVGSVFFLRLLEGYLSSSVLNRTRTLKVNNYCLRCTYRIFL